LNVKIDTNDVRGVVYERQGDRVTREHNIQPKRVPGQEVRFPNYTTEMG